MVCVVSETHGQTNGDEDDVIQTRRQEWRTRTHTRHDRDWGFAAFAGRRRTSVSVRRRSSHPAPIHSRSPLRFRPPPCENSPAFSSSSFSSSSRSPVVFCVSPWRETERVVMSNSRLRPHAGCYKRPCVSASAVQVLGKRVHSPWKASASACVWRSLSVPVSRCVRDSAATYQSYG